MLATIERSADLALWCTKSIQKAAPAPPLSALQRLSIASRDSQLNKEKVSLSSLARKSQPLVIPSPLSNSSSAPKASLQTLAIASKVSASIPSTDSPPTPKSSLLARRAAAAAAGSPKSISGSVPSPRQSKLAQKVLKTQSASRNAIYQPPSQDSLTEGSATKAEGANASPSTKCTRDVFPISSSSKSSDELQRLSRCAATSTSEFASILVQAQSSPPLTAPPYKSSPLSRRSDALAGSRGAFVFNSPSPDDIVMGKRSGTKLARRY